VEVLGHEPEPQTMYAFRHESGNGIYKRIMKEEWGMKFDPGQSEPNENTCGDVLENYLGVANMALRFPQVVKPLGEPLELLKVQIELSCELADLEMSYVAPSPAASLEAFIPDWDPDKTEVGPASKKAKQGEPDQPPESAQSRTVTRRSIRSRKHRHRQPTHQPGERQRRPSRQVSG